MIVLAVDDELDLDVGRDLDIRLRGLDEPHGRGTVRKRKDVVVDRTGIK